MDGSGKANCVCQKRCSRREKLVCGTDGRIYKNHCELHRTACVEDRSIAVDHSFGCSKPRKKPLKGELRARVPPPVPERKKARGASRFKSA